MTPRAMKARAILVDSNGLACIPGVTELAGSAAAPNETALRGSAISAFKRSATSMVLAKTNDRATARPVTNIIDLHRARLSIENAMHWPQLGTPGQLLFLIGTKTGVNRAMILWFLICLFSASAAARRILPQL
jgi:hypothetical protein